MQSNSNRITLCALWRQFILQQNQPLPPSIMMGFELTCLVPQTNAFPLSHNTAITATAAKHALEEYKTQSQLNARIKYKCKTKTKVNNIRDVCHLYTRRLK